MRIALPEQVWLDLEPANFASRSVAFTIDFLLRWGLIFIFAYLALLISVITVGRGAGVNPFSLLWGLVEEKDFLYLVLALGVIVFFIVEFSYSVFFEVRREGVSPGKRILGLRVVDERGLPVTFRAAMLRVLLLPVDLLPALGVTAFVSMLVTKKSQRLGDLVAKTMVVHELPPPEVYQDPNVLGETAQSEFTVPVELYRAVGEFIQRQEELNAEARERIRSALFEAFGRFGLEDQRQCLTSVQVLQKLFTQMRPVRTAQSASKAERALDWRSLQQEFREFEQQLKELGRATVGASKLKKIAQDYQRLCQRYSHLSTFYPKSPEAFQAAQLVRLGRYAIYGSRLTEHEDAQREPFWRRVPASLLAIWPYVIFSFVVGASGALFAALVVQINPSFAWYFLSEEMAAGLSQGKLWTEQIEGKESFFSAVIMTNNIRVACMAFALGVTCGIGTFLVLLVNGAHLGGIFAALANYRMANKLLEFIAAHGVLELSIIFVAGGMGLFLGDAIIRPQERTRKAALQEHGRLIFDLVVFNALCLIVAGIVEAYISPNRTIPVGAKFALGITLGAAYWGYLLGGAREKLLAHNRNRGKRSLKE